MHVTPLEELEQRVQNLQSRLQQGSLDGALLTEKMDLFYFAGSMQQGFLFVPPEGEPLFMVKRNFDRARAESTWKNILPFSSFKKLHKSLKEYTGGDLKRIGLELDVLPVNLYERLQRAFPVAAFCDISLTIREIRMIKSAYEIGFLRKAAEASMQVNRQIPALLAAGITELQLSLEIERLLRERGHQGVLRMRAFNMEMFFGHIYSGENGANSSFLDSCTGGEGLSAASPQGAGRKLLAPHEPIGIDFSSIHEGYILDETRLFSIGALPPAMEEAYAVARQIHDAVAALAAPGASCGDLYEYALEIAKSRGLAENFMGYGEGQVKFIGHGVGLDLDELPVLAKGARYALEPGMVFALEPKFVFPGKGMIGLENVWHVTDAGAEKLTLIPDEMVTVAY